MKKLGYGFYGYRFARHGWIRSRSVYLCREEAQRKHVPIVAMTAHVFVHNRKRCFDVEMDDVMAKPIMQDDFYQGSQTMS
ncbi:hypothetical protein [Coxiella-like endosymbiont of Rhipicephalus sanguineus]|uniref:hypothetical protein n=1 Tax=Coxiella-like endosymbiont of Rhipicephalus sanguineus TaxID=1955402 RepID=UPI00203C91BC|nr:hypothetical protein [Coxiella-like endosymbiont of Rhipicephalus sanguineus]